MALQQLAHGEQEHCYRGLGELTDDHRPDRRHRHQGVHVGCMAGAHAHPSRPCHIDAARDDRSDIERIRRRRRRAERVEQHSQQKQGTTRTGGDETTAPHCARPPATASWSAGRALGHDLVTH